MSLINILKRKTKFSFFTTPSHSQSTFIFKKIKQFYKYDISETDVHKPQKALEQAQNKASKIYGTKSTRFLANGSTSGIIAAVLSCVKPNEKVLVWNKAHDCHHNAIKLAGAFPVYYDVDVNKDWGIYLQITPDKIEESLKNENVKAVIITSPTYEGVVSDIAKIKEICQKHGAYLIVDEAHGALYPFSDKLPDSAIYKGADFVIQSLHKTAGGLNPTALLHCNTDVNIKEAIETISTTSPSYPLLASIEKNINFLNSNKGRKKIQDLITNIEIVKSNVPNCDFYTENDPTKILVKSTKITGFELSELLYNHKIEDEKTNEKSTMLLCGIGTTHKKLKILEKALKQV